MKVAVIDNYDSFVYNLVQYVGELGADPVVFRNDVDLNQIERMNPDRIIISPGPGRPENAGITVEVIRCFHRTTPILGVCLGHQAIAYAFGGRIVHAKRIMHGKVSRIKHSGDPIFDGIPNPFTATRYHSLSVDRSSIPSCLRIIAETLDRDREIMGIRHIECPVYGVQFHPESIMTRHGKRLLRNFLNLRP